MSVEKVIKRTSLGEYILECKEGKGLVMWKENQLSKDAQRGAQQETEKLKNMPVSRRNEFFLVAFLP